MKNFLNGHTGLSPERVAQLSLGGESWVRVRTDFTPPQGAMAANNECLCFLKTPGRYHTSLLPFIGLLILYEFAIAPLMRDWYLTSNRDHEKRDGDRCNEDHFSGTGK